ncbi:MAG TPA: hypothetical protein DCL63_06235 [Firmicutes bacterium]|nr:hypothetical protein [Bacillota bacterium]HBK61161.1 hypothetical protein [Bacillota bacterium]
MSRRRDLGAVLISAAAFCLVVACVIVQAMIASGGIARRSLLIEKTEGQVVWTWDSARGDRVAPAGPAAESGGVLLALPEALESIIVLVNGQAVADFRYTQAAVVVHRGDLVEIEMGEDYSHGGAGASWLQVEVVDVTPNIRAPLPGVRIHLMPGRTAFANIVI